MRQPHNRLIVDGHDLFLEYGMVLSDGYTLSPPKPKSYLIDVPGADGSIDLTDAFRGGPSFSNREQSFVFGVIDPENFEETKTKVSNFLHGRAFDYELTMDPGYTYHGRFSIDEYYSEVYIGYIKITVSADPYKSKGLQTYVANAAGGTYVFLESGRKPVCPTFEFGSETIVRMGDVRARMQRGSYKVPGLWLKEGINQIYLNSNMDSGTVPISEYESDLVSAHANTRISDLMWEVGEAGSSLVYIQYDWSDL